jgi:hypothetical protein
MSVIASYNLTLSDLAKMEDPKGNIAAPVNLLAQTNDLWNYLPFIECNDGTSHQTVIVTGLPQGAWVRYNQGRAPAKSTKQQIRATTGMLELPIVVDKHLAEKRGTGRVDELMAKETMLAIEGLSQQAMTALFYEDESTNPERITGLSPHYSTVNTATAASAENVIDCGGTQSDNMSIWMLELGEGKISGLLPEGGKSGVQRGGRRLVDIQDAVGIAGATFEAYKETLTWRLGMLVENWNCGVRLCNIDSSSLVANAGAQADLWVKIIDGMGRLPGNGSGKRVICMNRRARTWLRIQALSKSAYQTTFETVAGKPVTMIDGIPVVTCDALLNTESRVV